jgi:hypothetical protein
VPVCSLKGGCALADKVRRLVRGGNVHGRRVYEHRSRGGVASSSISQ